MACAFKQDQGHFIGAERSAQGIVEELTLLRRDIAVTGAVLDKKGRIVGCNVGGRVYQLHCFHIILDRIVYKLGIR